MDTSFLLKGLIIGFSIAVPVGPISLLCIRRTLSEGGVSGLASGIGAATADAIYSCIAGFGLTFVSNVLIEQQVWLQFIGGMFLFYLGLKTFRTKPIEQVVSEEGNSLVGAYASTFFLTLMNPITVLAFTAMFAGLGLTERSYVSAAVLVMGVFIGSSLWWVILSYSVSVLRTKFNPYDLQWVNRISGITIAGFGLIALLSLRGEK